MINKGKIYIGMAHFMPQKKICQKSSHKCEGTLRYYVGLKGHFILLKNRPTIALGDSDNSLFIVPRFSEGGFEILTLSTGGSLTGFSGTDRFEDLRSEFPVFRFLLSRSQQYRQAVKVYSEHPTPYNTIAPQHRYKQIPYENGSEEL